jgi:uncharacterized phage-associated protein
MAKFTVDEVADTLISLAREQSIDISNLKLQKLLYYAQAWNLAFYREPLFDDEFEAWVHGPVVPAIFQRFKGYRWNEITEQVSPRRDVGLQRHLQEVLRTYGHFTPNQLERLTHSERPWQEARDGLSPDIPSRMKISRKSMIDFYSGLMDGAKEGQEKTRATTR